MRLRIETPRRGFARVTEESIEPMQRAAQQTVEQVSEDFKREGRSEIASSGFSRRWQNALRVTRYPRRRNQQSLDGATWAHHRIPYAGIFETGANVSGRPMLWLPLPTAPRQMRRRRFPPERFAREVGDLWGFRSPGGTPLLAAQARVSKRQAQRRHPQASMAALRRGVQGRGILRSIPLYHGVHVARIGRRFNLTGVARRVAARIPDYFDRFSRNG